jgi:hypothetical protein
MLFMITAGRYCNAHPAFWAKFVLVGEGGPFKIVAMSTAADMSQRGALKFERLFRSEPKRSRQVNLFGSISGSRH